MSQRIQLDREEIVRLYNSGQTTREIGEAMCCSDGTIELRMKEWGIPRRPRGQPVGKFLPSGGRTVDKSGYILLKANDHPYANKSGYVREHRLVVEKVLGRYLRPDEVVHHRNGQKDDNRPENLAVYDTQAGHKRDEMRNNSFSAKTHTVRGYVLRTREEKLADLRALASELHRPIRRVDLVPPHTSYRALNKEFGDWREAIRLALGSPQGSTAPCTPSPTV